MWHYILKDFKSMFKTQRFLVILLISIQLISTIIIFFAYGVTNHYNTQIGVTEGTDLSYDIQPVDLEKKFTYDEIINFHNAIIEQFEHKLEVYAVGLGEEKEKYLCITAIVRYVDGEYTVASNTFCERAGLIYMDESADIYNSNEYIIEQFDKGSKVMLIPDEKFEGQEYVKFFGDEYKVIGVLKNVPLGYIPFKCLPKNADYNCVIINLSEPLLETEYRELEEIVESTFDGKAYCGEFHGIKNENQYRVYRSIIAILVAFVVMSGVNYSIIFSHILDKRRRMLAVSRVCGCTGIKSIIIYMVEIMSVSLITLAGGMLIFIYGILPKIKSTFEYIEYYLNTKVYIELALIYIGILIVIYLILVLRYTGKTPVRLMKEV